MPVWLIFLWPSKWGPPAQTAHRDCVVVVPLANTYYWTLKLAALQIYYAPPILSVAQFSLYLKFYGQTTSKINYHLLASVSAPWHSACFFSVGLFECPNVMFVLSTGSHALPLFRGMAKHEYFDTEDGQTECRKVQGQMNLGAAIPRIETLISNSVLKPLMFVLKGWITGASNRRKAINP